MIASHFLLDQARRLGFVPDITCSSELDGSKQDDQEPSSPERFDSSVADSSKIPVDLGFSESFMVKDLNTGDIFHAEKESKALLERYKVADPKKILHSGWWGASQTLTMPPSMFRLAETEGESVSYSSNLSELSQSVDIKHKALPSTNLIEIALEEEDGGLIKLPAPDAELIFIRISGTGTSKDSQGGEYTTYFMEVHCKGADPPQWRVYRRYREFKALAEELRKCNYNAPALPPRKLIGVLDRYFVEQRRVELESWLYQLIDYPDIDPSVLDPQNFAPFRAFLLADADNPPPSMQIHSEGEKMVDMSLGWGGLGVAPNQSTDTYVKGSTRQKIGMEDFELVRVIGKGSFGKVTLVRKVNTGKYYAMKVLAKEHLEKSKQVEHTRTERRVLGCINHPFIVSMHYAWTTQTKVCFVLDYCPGGELFFHLSQRKRFPEYMARFYSAEIALALEHLHDNDIVYRDLKPENIILDAEGHVKLADFGLAKTGVRSPTSGATSLCGTPEYLSPEIINRKGHGTAVDWWSLGMVLYEMLTGLPPWYTTDRKKLFQRLRGASLSFPYYVSQSATDIINGFLIRDPSKRLGAGNFEDVKSRRFFKCVDWDALLQGHVKAPFNPCRTRTTATDTRNFDKQFTRLPLVSVADENEPVPAALGSSDGTNRPMSQNFRHRGTEEEIDSYVGFTYRGSALYGCGESASRQGLSSDLPELLMELESSK